MITWSDDLLSQCSCRIVLDHVRDDFMLQHEELGAKPGWFMHEDTPPHYAPSSFGLVKTLRKVG
jgi:hypothetical protein